MRGREIEGQAEVLTLAGRRSVLGHSEVVDGQLFLYYLLENHSEATVLTDILRLRIFDGRGDRLAFRINRASQDSYLGRLETGGVEYGVIAVDAAEKTLIMEWKLIGFRSGAQQLVRAEVQVP